MNDTVFDNWNNLEHLAYLCTPMGKIDTAFAALGGEWKRENCTCDPDVNHFCEYCALFDGLGYAKREIERLKESLLFATSTSDERIEQLQEELEEAERDIEVLQDQLDKVDIAVGDALESIGRFPSKPAGFWDRVDTLVKIVLESAGTAGSES